MSKRAIALLVLVGAGVLLFGALALGGGERARDRASTFVPSDALLYLQLAGEREGEQADRADELARDVPGLAALRAGLLRRISTSGGGFDWDRDVRPWLGEEAVATLVGPDPDAARTLLVLRVGDEERARRFADELTPEETGSEHRGIEVTGSDQVATAFTKGFLLIGPAALVRRALDVRAGAAPALADEEQYRSLRDGLPAERLAHAYASGVGLDALLAGPGALLAGIPGITGFRAASLGISIEDERARVSFRGLSDPTGAAPDARCAGRRGGDRPAASDVSDRSVAFIGISGADCLLQRLIATPESALGRILRRFALDSRQLADVDFVRDVLPLLARRAALTVTPGSEGRPVLTLSAAGIDVAKALETLGRLQPALTALVPPELSGQAAAFVPERFGKLQVLTATLAPGLELSYAGDGDRLFFSTSRSGVPEAQSGRGLDGNEEYRQVVGDEATGPADVLFADLDGLLALGDRLGLLEEPAYAAVREDLARLGAAGAVISRQGETTTAELLFKKP